MNVPARAKFLRSAAVETRAVVDAVVTLSLSHLSAAFRLESNDRVLLELPPASDLASRVAALWGDEAAGRFIPVGGRWTASRWAASSSGRTRRWRARGGSTSS
jgi:DNA mismatch repair protein MutL